MCENKLITKKVVGYIRLSKEDEKKEWLILVHLERKNICNQIVM